MSQDFDVNKIATDFLQNNLDRVLQAVASTAKDAKNTIKARLHHTYKTYVDRLLARHGRGKSFFVRSEPIPLYDFFVPLDLSGGRRILSHPTAADLGKAAPLSIITGTGGSGKTMMMRHLLVSALTSGEKTPIFLELRNLNHTATSVRTALLGAFEACGLEVDDDFLEAALRAGQLFVLLDGFDEVEHSARKRIATEIKQLSERYPNNWVSMSSRLDSTLDGWDTFAKLSVTPLTLPRAVELVKKVPFDESIKARFTEDMQSHLFARHSSFLSHPLLLSIMLLTYSDVANIPHKVSTFYSQAFEALFHRHDALKSGFQRERRCELDIQDCGRAFAAFSLLSYDRREVVFTATRAIELINSAKEVAMLSFDSQAFLDDAVQAVCILVEDGLQLTFAHRSFQEYFVARFIVSSPPNVKAKLVERFSPNVGTDEVMALLYEMDPYIVERCFILPRLRTLRKEFGIVKKVGVSHLLRYLRKHYELFEIEPGGKIVARVSTDNDDDWFVFNRYRDLKSISPEVESDDLEEAFRAEAGGTETIDIKKMKPGGPFLKALSTHGVGFSLRFLQALMDIEQETTARHAENKETLEQLFARSPSTRNQST